MEKLTYIIIYLTHNGKKISFTKREVDSIKQLNHGHTVKEVAKLMHISPRTVEDYLNNIKSKLGLRKKSEIIDILLEHDFLNL